MLANKEQGLNYTRTLKKKKKNRNMSTVFQLRHGVSASSHLARLSTIIDGTCRAREILRILTTISDLEMSGISQFT